MQLAKNVDSLKAYLLESVLVPVAEAMPPKVRETFYLRAFGFFKVPLLYFTRPSVVELTDQRCVVKIPLTRRTKNHLHSMYFGTLAVGADCAGGLMAMKHIRAQGNQVSLVFKDFQAQFLKRPHADVHFTCEDGTGIRDLIQKAMETGERQNMSVHVTATAPSSDLGTEPVAKFVLTLSVKKKKSSNHPC